MWSYYGSKTNIIDFYPAPKHDSIIEPFAGTARYSLKHFEKEILIVDKYEVLIRVWKWLQLCSEKDLLSLPRFFKKGDTLDNFNFDCNEAKYFVGFLLGFSTTSPRNMATIKFQQRPNFANFLIKKAASELYKIRHWKIELGSYTDIENKKATWFIDPPYEFGGHSYVESNKNIDFKALSQWCKNRDGQVIVCENNKATWLPFIPLKTQKTRLGIQSEFVWMNEKTIYNNKQQSLF